MIRALLGNEQDYQNRRTQLSRGFFHFLMDNTVGVL